MAHESDMQRSCLTPLVSANADDEILMSLAEDFSAQLASHLAEAAEALEREDFGTVAAIAHKVRGSALTYGYPDLASSLNVLESAARTRAPAKEQRILLRAAFRLADRIQLGLRPRP